MKTQEMQALAPTDAIYPEKAEENTFTILPLDITGIQ